MPTTKSRRLRSTSERELLRRAELDELERARKRLRLGRKANVSGTRSSAASPSDSITAAMTFFVGACIATFLFFENPYLQPFEAYRLVNAAVLLWIPWMVVTLFLKQDLQHFGLTRGDRKSGLKIAAISVMVMLPALVIISLQPNFREYYGASLAQPLAIVGYAARSGWTPPVRALGLTYYELFQGFYFFCWEFFFRGFLLFGLARARFIGPVGAVILQAIPFTLLHWSIVPAASKPPIEIASALIGGLILGWIAVRTKTFFYGFLIHWAIALILDLLLVGSMLVHTR